MLLVTESVFFEEARGLPGLPEGTVPKAWMIMPDALTAGHLSMNPKMAVRTPHPGPLPI